RPQLALDALEPIAHAGVSQPLRLACEGERRVERGAADPDRHRADHRTRRVERLHGALEAGLPSVVLLAAEQVGGRDAALAQRERGRLVGLEAHLRSILKSPRPGVPRSTRKARCPARPRAGSTVAHTTIQSARLALAANDLSPESSQESPSRRALVRMPATSEPAPGSVIANEPQRGRSGARKGARKRSFCSRVP